MSWKLILILGLSLPRPVHFYKLFRYCKKFLNGQYLRCEQWTSNYLLLKVTIQPMDPRAF